MILGAGIGSRLDPLTRSLPKPLVPIVGKPVMGHLMDLLRKHGINEIMVNVQYLGHKIKETIGDGARYGVSVRYSDEEALCGDAGGVKRCEDFFRDDPDDTFLVIGGDDLTDTDIGRVVAAHRDRKATATLAVTPVEDPSEYGIVVLDERGYITASRRSRNGARRSRTSPTPGSTCPQAGLDSSPGHVLRLLATTSSRPDGRRRADGRRRLRRLLEGRRQPADLPAGQRDCMDGKCAVEFPVPRTEMDGRPVWVSRAGGLLGIPAGQGPW
jgi:hypothetical protein